MREYIWTFDSPARAATAARLLTVQNMAGRQALGCPMRRFEAVGRELWAMPMG
jgi:hypothetical protein